MAGTLVAEALAHGDLGLAVATLAPGSVATAIGLWGTDEQQQTYLPAFTGDDVPAAALALTEPTVLFDVLAPTTTATRDRRRLRPQRREVAGPARRRRRAVRGRRPPELDGAPALFLVESGTDGLSVEADPSMGVRAAVADPASSWTRSSCPPSAVLGARRRHDVRRVRAALAAGLVRARGRHRPGGARLRDAVRQGARGVRRAGRAPPVGGVHGRQHRDRAAGDAAADLQGGRRGSPPARTSPGRSRWRGRLCATRACRSASTACSCSAATGSSRSTRWSGGTATSGPIGVMEGAVLV